MQPSWDSYDEALAAAVASDAEVTVSRCRLKGGGFKYFLSPAGASDEQMWEVAMEIRAGRALTPDERIAATLFAKAA